MAGASINDIKARMKSVQGTMQITKAMELVATSKLRGAKTKAENSKPYMQTLAQAIKTISGFVSEGESVYTKKGSGKTLYIVIAGDRGLAGGYNNNVIKAALSLDPDLNGVYLPIGKKARDYAIRHKIDVFENFTENVDDIGVGACMRIADAICKSFKNGEISSVELVYTKFVSMLTQTPITALVLPLPEENVKTNSAPIFECETEELMEQIVPQYVGGILHAAICESAASEAAARRSAMNSANKNAEEMIDTLVLKFNRARQAVITQEITEIVSGAEAL